MTKETLVTAQGKKQMCCETTIELNDEQFEKLTDNNLAKRVDNIIKDLHVDWAINVQSGKNILSVTRTTTGPIDDEYRHNLEIAAANFMSAVEELQCDEPKCPSHENTNLTEEERKTIDFVETLLHDINLPEGDEDSVVGGIILCYGPKNIPVPLSWGKISSNLLEEMCKLYLQAHDK